MSITVASPFFKLIIAGAQAKGFDTDSILAKCGISPSLLDQPRARLDYKLLAKLSRYLVTLLDDETYGLMQKPLKLGTFELVCYSAIHANTIDDALQLFSKAGNIVSNGLAFDYGTQSTATSILKVSRTTGCKILNCYALEHTLLSLHRTLCWMAGKRLSLKQVYLDYPKPPHSDEYRHIFWGAPVKFSHHCCGLVFERNSVASPNVRTASDLKQFVRNLPLTLVNETLKSDVLSVRVRHWLTRQLQEQQILPNLEQTAAQFRLHPKKLSRELLRENTHFQQIKLEVRRDRVVQLMNNPDLSFESIAEYSQFSEASAFHRAFKKWTGLTPQCYRDLLLKNAVAS